MRPWLTLVLIACTCNRESRAKHEELAHSLKQPVALLCETRHAEGGGCYAECQTRLSAREGRAAVEASQAFVAIPRVDDPETEKLLGEVRSRASELHALLERECPTPVSVDAPVTPEITRCSDATRKNGAALAKLFGAIELLATRTEERVGTKLPSKCPRS